MNICYLDSGVFLTPLLGNREPEVVDACKRWLLRIASGDVQAVTSWLTWDEVVWFAGRAGGPFDPKRAAAAGGRFRALPNIRFRAVDDEVVRKAEDLMKEFGVHPRDSIHASTALLHASGTLVTLDSDFRTRASTAAGLNVIEIRGR